MSSVHKIEAIQPRLVIEEVTSLLLDISGSLGMLSALAARDDDELTINPHDLRGSMEMLRGQAAIAYRKLSSIS